MKQLSNDNDMKECTTCNEVLHIEHYHKGKTRCKTCTKAYYRDWSKTKAGKESIQNRALKRYYDITLIEYDNLLSSQGGRCAICRTDNPGGKGRFLVDHDHKTNKIRGLLCHNCNSMLGFSRDSQLVLERAIIYLTETFE